MSNPPHMELVQEKMEANWGEVFQFDGHFFAEVRRRYDQYRRKWGEPAEKVSKQELQLQMAEKSRKAQTFLAGLKAGTVKVQVTGGHRTGGTRTPRVRGIGN